MPVASPLVLVSGIIARKEQRCLSGRDLKSRGLMTVHHYGAQYVTLRKHQDGTRRHSHAPLVPLASPPLQMASAQILAPLPPSYVL